MRARVFSLLLLGLYAAPALAQESQFHADLRREGDDLRQSCGGGFDAKKIMDCAVSLATEDPVHIAVGSLPPLNGIGFGLAFAEHFTPNERWRISWNADAVVAPSASWRAGGYIKVVHTPESPVIVVRNPGTTSPTTPTVAIAEYPVFNAYVQTISLGTLTVAAGQNPFSERQTIIGGNAIYPLGIRALRPLRPSLIGAINGRFLSVDSGLLAAPPPAFAQFEEGIRLKPSIFDDRLRLNYLVGVEQFAASAASHATFHRWSIDLQHSIPLYHTVSSSGPKDTNGPDECFQSLGSTGCPVVSYSHNLEGSVGFRLLASRSAARGPNEVPFYFQPTLGGSDINGQRVLSGYDDYRFRGPAAIALQESVEHSVWGPIGVFVLAEQGKVTARGHGVDFNDLAHSVAVGLTLRAGGFPLVTFSFAWSPDGHRFIGTIDASLLGGSGRPSLY
jgi:hypothetical protein